jgi:hypothetical protein
LIIFGLATSVPLIVAGSAILMALLERFRVLVWGGGALLGWVAGDIMSTDPAVIGWVGQALAHDLHAWGGRLGSLIVMSAGLWIVRKQRPLHAEEIWTFAALLLWIAGDMAINIGIEEAATAKRWSARLVVLFILVADYVVLRSRLAGASREPNLEDPVHATPKRKKKAARRTK